MRLLLPLLGVANDKASLAAAFALAGGCKAHIDACFVRPDPEEEIPYFGAGDPSIEGWREEYKRHAEQTAAQALERARRQFNGACRKWGIRMNGRPGETEGSSAQWRESAGRPGLAIPKLARVRDLTVFGGPLEDYHLFVPSLLERTLLHSGRPLLFASKAAIAFPIETAVIAWDGSLSATRAVATALPLLKRARKIEVLTFKELYSEPTDPNLLVEYLAWHGLSSHGFTLTKNHNSTAHALILEGAERDADVLVMGGFAHNRFEEFVFGGTTLEVLRHCSVPVLMMH